MTTYTGPRLGALLPISRSRVTRDQFLRRAELDGWLVPSVARRDGPGSRAEYNEEDLYVGRVVLAVYPAEDRPDTGRAINPLRVDLAKRLRQFQGWRWMCLTVRDDKHVGGFTDDLDDVLRFVVGHHGEVIKIVDLSVYREGGAKVA